MAITHNSGVTLGGVKYQSIGKTVADEYGEKIGEFITESLARKATLALNTAQEIVAAAWDGDGAEMEQAAMQGLIDGWNQAAP